MKLFRTEWPTYQIFGLLVLVALLLVVMGVLLTAKNTPAPATLGSVRFQTTS